MATCHWCHVMERESFEDESVAAFLNQNYVSIKVDREERPDIDSIYMTVCQAMTGQGGWPLTIVMTPEKKPFFAGTYFPKERRYGRNGLVDIFEKIAQEWQNNREKVEESGQRIVEALNSQPENHDDISTTVPDKTLLDDAYEMFTNTFDAEYGGFGDAPKFPSPHNLSFLLRYHHVTHTARALEMVKETLTAIAKGGIRDHLGGGFSRYSVDRRWLIPHFEKMLYDNAMLALAYLEAYQVTGEPEFADTAREIFDYVLRDMQAAEGGFFSAEDADSEGEEGKFYAWTPKEINFVLGDDFGPIFCRYFGVTEYGNFDGKNVLNLIGQNISTFCQQEGLIEKDFQEELKGAREKLWLHREQRVHPHKDDKILTAWNGLMIAALAKGFTVLGDDAYLKAAESAVDFVLENLRRADGRLLARYRDGEGGVLGYLDDYAFFIYGLTELYEATFTPRYLKVAVELTQDMQGLFWDNQNHGFFLYGIDGEQLISRPKEVYDGAIPSGNSVAAMNLLRLSRLTGQTEWAELAHQCLATFAPEVSRYPAGYTFYLMAISFAAYPEYEIILNGDTADDNCRSMIAEIRNQYLPHTVVVMNNAQADMSTIAPFLKHYPSTSGKTTAYVCQEFACQAPTSDVEEFGHKIQRIY